MSTEAAPAPTPAAPDWDAIEEDIRCPLCDYNLRGLTIPRCPECGYIFAWPELLDPTKRLHPYLFEHHPERNAYTWLRTALNTWLPRRFWRTLLPNQPSWPLRMIVYWLIPVVAYAILVTVSQGVDAYIRSTRAPFIPVRTYVIRSITRPDFVLAAAVPILWPGLVFAALQVFRISMRRARVRTAHTLRCILYSYDFLIALACVGILTVVMNALGVMGARLRVVESVLIACLPGMAIGLYRTWMAYRYYLRFDHPFWTVLAAHVIAFLLVPFVIAPLAALWR